MARPTRLTSQQKRKIRELIAKHDPLIRQAFEAAIQNARGELDFDELVRAVRRADWYGAAQMMWLNQAMMFPLEEAVRAATIAGGMSVELPKGIAGTFGFNGRHPRAEQLIAETGARLVTEIGSPGPEAVREVVLQGQREGIGAEKVSRRLAGTINPTTGIREGGIMGLDGPRAKRSARVREILSDPEKIRDYFIKDRKTGKWKPRYANTDRRFDAQVRKAIVEGRALDKTTLEKITKAHDARLLKSRGQTIARNEAFTAQAQGRNEAFRQLQDSGKVESMKKRWQHASAKDPRHYHRALDGKEIGMDETFEMSDLTQLRYPHDPGAPAKHKLGCRCSVIYIPKFRRPGA